MRRCSSLKRTPRDGEGVPEPTTCIRKATTPRSALCCRLRACPAIVTGGAGFVRTMPRGVEPMGRGRAHPGMARPAHVRAYVLRHAVRLWLGVGGASSVPLPGVRGDSEAAARRTWWVGGLWGRPCVCARGGGGGGCGGCGAVVGVGLWGLWGCGGCGAVGD